MKVSGIKLKLLRVFALVLIIITALNVSLEIYLTDQQSKREAFSGLVRQAALLEKDMQLELAKLSSIAQKETARVANLSDMSTLYAQAFQMTDAEQALNLERSFGYNKTVSINRLQVVLRSAGFSSIAVYMDNELSHYVTQNEAGMTVLRNNQKALIRTIQNSAEDLNLNNWPNWTQGDVSQLIPPTILPTDQQTISFDFSAEQMVVMQIIIPVQAITHKVMRHIETSGFPLGVLVEDLAIAKPESLNRNLIGQKNPQVIGAFVFKKAFDRIFLEQLSLKTGFLPALYSPDGLQQIQTVDLKIKPAELAHWVQQGNLTPEHPALLQQHTLMVDQETYYQALTVLRYDDAARLIIGFAQSGASTAQKVKETVTGLITLAILVIIVVGISGYVLLDRLVKPIVTLTENVSRIGLNTQINSSSVKDTPMVSDKLVEIDLKASDEVGQLANAFNIMIRQLRQSFENLEQHVIERTREIEIARENAEAANHAKSMFLANMSHELRTPLNAILGFSSMMQREPELAEGQLEKLDIINRSGEHLLKLINDVLEIARIESGRMEIKTAPLDLGALIYDVIDLMRLRSEEKGLQLELDQSSDFPRYIMGDEVRIRQILVNLIGNAVKFTNQGGITIRFNLRQNNKQHLLIEVEDSGPGISEEDQKLMFKPFVQVGAQDTREGTGLGLAITRQFVEMMSGSIAVKSTPGKGSIFSVDLPVELADEAAISLLLQTSDTGKVTGLAPGQPEYRILIVEDQRENQLLLARLMESVGLQVKIAENGEQGVQLFKSWHPHFIWMDQRMPVMDGMEATRRIRKLPEGRDVKIVAVTASAFREQEQEMREAGIDDYVRKPYNLDKIFQSMEKLLGLTWIYAEADSERETPLVAPPGEQLLVLNQLAEEGHIFEIQKMATRLEAENETYIPFARQLQKLAKGFDIERITAFIKQFLHEGKEN